MSNMTLYNKYRPKTFSEVIGQNRIVASLKEGIKKKRLPHAILFSGIQGTGKTTLARLVARRLNCFSDKKELIEPCNECTSCKDALEGRHPDIIELDAASERGIDNIRELKNSANFVPMYGKNKIYIIDEVHDLTSQAMDAILKLLEEPPPNIYFIFATTDLYKVSKTVQSRCTIFRLWHVDSDEIVKHLVAICDKEEFKYDREALNEVARIAKGSIRDSISFLEAIASVGVDLDAVYHYSDSVSPSKMFDMLDGLFTANLKKYVNCIEDMFVQGVNAYGIASEFLNSIMEINNIRLGVIREKLLPKYVKEKYVAYANACEGDLLSALTEFGKYYPFYDDIRVKIGLLHFYEVFTHTSKKSASKELPSVKEVQKKSEVPAVESSPVIDLRKYAYWLKKQLSAEVIYDSLERVTLKMPDNFLLDCVMAKDGIKNTYYIFGEDIYKLSKESNILDKRELLQSGVIKYGKS